MLHKKHAKVENFKTESKTLRIAGSPNMVMDIKFSQVSVPAFVKYQTFSIYILLYALSPPYVGYS